MDAPEDGAGNGEPDQGAVPAPGNIAGAHSVLASTLAASIIQHADFTMRAPDRGLQLQPYQRSLTISDTTFQHAGEGPCKLRICSSELVPWCDPGRQRVCVVRMRRVTFAGNFELHIDDPRVVFIMEDCSASGPFGLTVASNRRGPGPQQVHLFRVDFGERCTGLSVTDRSCCKLQGCTIGLEEQAVIKVSNQAKLSITGSSIRGGCGVHASTLAAVALSRTTLRCDSMHAVFADSRATLDIGTCSISANDLVGTVVMLLRGATAHISASRLEGATGVCATRSALVKLWQSHVLARKYAVHACGSDVHIFEDCTLEAAEYAAVAAVHGCQLVLQDSNLRCTACAVVAIVDSDFVVVRNVMHAPAGPRSAAVVLNHMKSGSAMYGNVVHGGAAHLVKFAYSTREDKAAVNGQTELLQHRSFLECDVPSGQCAEYVRLRIHAAGCPRDTRRGPVAEAAGCEGDIACAQLLRRAVALCRGCAA